MIGVTKLEKMKNCVLFAHWIFFYSFCSRFFLNVSGGYKKREKHTATRQLKRKKLSNQCLES